VLRLWQRFDDVAKGDCDLLFFSGDLCLDKDSADGGIDFFDADLAHGCEGGWSESLVAGLELFGHDGQRHAIGFVGDGKPSSVAEQQELIALGINDLIAVIDVFLFGILDGHGRADLERFVEFVEGIGAAAVDFFPQPLGLS